MYTVSYMRKGSQVDTKYASFSDGLYWYKQAVWMALHIGGYADIQLINPKGKLVRHY